MSDGTPGDGEVLSPAEYLREHGADGVATIRHQYDPASSLLAPTPEEARLEQAVFTAVEAYDRVKLRLKELEQESTRLKARVAELEAALRRGVSLMPDASYVSDSKSALGSAREYFAEGMRVLRYAVEAMR